MGFEAADANGRLTDLYQYYITSPSWGNRVIYSPITTSGRTITYTNYFYEPCEPDQISEYVVRREDSDDKIAASAEMKRYIESLEREAEIEK